MITYLNPDNGKFKTDRNEEIYVDKTLIIEKLNSLVNRKMNKICVSRPRRFGKTMTANLLAAYYSCGCDSRELFSDTKLAEVSEWDKYLNKFNVIKFDVQGIYNSTKKYGRDLSTEIEIRVNEFLKSEFEKLVEIDVNAPLAGNIVKVYNVTNRQFVVIMDEYDVLVRNKESGDMLKNYLDLLNSLFKDDDIQEAFALVYLTGIFPIIKDTFQSKLNNFTEYSITNPEDFGGFIGFTESEVKDLCTKYDMDFTECKNWYDGYKMGKLESVYNPCSVILAMKKHKYQDYWTSTASFECISDYISQNINGLHDDIINMIENDARIKVDVTLFLNKIDCFTTKDDVFSYLIHIGYLSYDYTRKVCYIPNYEIREEWRKALSKVPELFPFYNFYTDCKNLYEALLDLDEDSVASCLDKIHHSSGDVNSFGNEAALHTSLVSALTYAGSFYNIHNEASTGKGRADILLMPKSQFSNNPVIIIELKVDKNADTALQQIIDREYGDELESYKDNMILVGINYNKKTKKHECKIEKFR